MAHFCQVLRTAKYPASLAGHLPGLPGAYASYGTRGVFTAHGTQFQGVAGRAWEGEWLVSWTSEAMPVCINHQFKTISHLQLGKDGREVVPYSRLADA